MQRSASRLHTDRNNPPAAVPQEALHDGEEEEEEEEGHRGLLRLKDAQDAQTHEQAGSFCGHNAETGAPRGAGRGVAGNLPRHTDADLHSANGRRHPRLRHSHM